MYANEQAKPGPVVANQAAVQPGPPAAKYNDVIWAILFAVNVAAVVVAAVLNFKNIHLQDSSSSNATPDKESTAIIAGLAVGFVGSVAFGLGWVRVLNHPRISSNLIKFAMFANVALMLVAGVASLAAGAVGAGVIFIVFGLLGAVWYYFVRNRIEFTTIMLEMATTCIKQYGASVYVAFFMQVVSIVWAVVWTVAVLGAAGANSGIVAFLLILSLYWTSNVLMNVVQVIAGGVAATWYYQSQTRNVTSASAKRALTTSFGSICYGSFIVSLIETLRVLARSMSRDHWVMACIIDCILGCIQAIAQFITKYAYAYVAIWGQDFCSAAKNTWELLQRRGLDVIVNDDMSGLAFWLSALIGGVAGAVIGGVVYAGAGGHDNAAPVMILCFFLGAFLTGVVMSVLEACVVTFMVLWAEEPAALATHHPALHQKLTAAVRRIYPSVGLAV